VSKSKLSTLVTEVDIFGTVVPVTYHDELIHDDGTKCLGMYWVGENKIELKDTEEIPYDSQLCTLLHECIEAIDSKLDLDMSHTSISSMETGIFQLFRDNPQLCKAFAIYKPRKSRSK